MSNEDFLKAAAYRAQVGSSFVVAFKARGEVIKVMTPRNAVVLELIGRDLRVSIECTDPSEEGYLRALGHMVLDNLNSLKAARDADKAAEHRKACVDGNP